MSAVSEKKTFAILPGNYGNPVRTASLKVRENESTVVSVDIDVRSVSSWGQKLIRIEGFVEYMQAACWCVALYPQGSMAVNHSQADTTEGLLTIYNAT